MNMPRIAIVIGLLLSVVGVAGYAASANDGHRSATAFIPLYVGVVFVVLGGLSIAKPDLRKHLMHALAALALLGTLAALGRLVPGLIKGTGTLTARLSIGAMAVLCGLTVALCVKSFRDARRARQSGELPAA